MYNYSFVTDMLESRVKRGKWQFKIIHGKLIFTQWIKIFYKIYRELSVTILFYSISNLSKEKFICANFNNFFAILHKRARFRRACNYSASIWLKYKNKANQSIYAILTHPCVLFKSHFIDQNRRSKIKFSNRILRFRLDWI